MKYRVRHYPVSELSPGMIVGETIVSETGKVMLDENAVLNDTLIRLLFFWGVETIPIKETGPSRLKFLNTAAAENQAFVATHREITAAVKDAFDKIRCLREVPVQQFAELANRCYSSLVSSPGVMNHLMTIYETDDYTFRHSVNVSIIAGVIGKWLGIMEDLLQDLVLAGMLHDVGKTQIPLSILNKPGKLAGAEMELMKEHAAKGADLLAASCQLPDSVTSAIRQHHERMDGTGYPCRLHGDKISLTAKVIAIADIYDAMTSNRVYRTAVTPFAVAAEFSKDMFAKLAPEICTVFLNNLAQSLIGCTVRLSDASTAKVICINKHHLDRPTLQATDGTFVNLTERRDLTILGIISD
ncbi:MAG: HD-GYP domain-containing protein [Negativicutes bacterium]|nr:HD-GYP domain-containing protein [Negativicutes bacterium]